MHDPADPAAAPMNPGVIPPRRERHLPLTLLSVVLLVVVAIVQRPGAPDPRKVVEARTGSVVEPVSVNPLVGFGKGLMWFKENSKQPVPDIYLKLIDDSARSAPDRFRAAVLMGELVDAEARQGRLEELEKDLAPESPLRHDIRAVETVSAGGTPMPEAAKELTERHGWFGRMILAETEPALAAAFKEQTQRDGFRLVLFLGLIGGGLFLAVLSGVIVLIIGVITAATGTLRPRFVRTAPELGSDRGLWLETFAVFLAGFLAVHFLGLGLTQAAGKDAAWPTIAVLFLQWGLALVVFWPLLRGMSWERFCGELGWHRGRGFFREVGAGILGYLAGLPVYFCMALLMALLIQVQHAIRSSGSGGAGGQGPPQDVPLPDNKVFDLVSGSGGWVLLLLASLIVVWAPVVEESIFRGALYRHIRTRLGLVLAAGLVAAAFALAHAYVLAGVIMVATLGATFALMREWRGSLIAPMTAHCLHNSMVLTLLLALLPLLKG